MRGKNFRWRFLACGLFALSLLAMGTSGHSQVVKLNYGGTSASSGQYVYCVAMTKAINDQVPEVRVTNIETGASVENARLLQRGDIDLGMMTIDVQFRAWNGLEEFK